MCIFIITLVLLLILGALFYVFMTWNFNYWRNRNVPGPKPQAFTGNIPNLLSQKRHMVYDILDIYREYRHKHDIVGIFSARSPQLLVTSPEMVRRVFVTDFKNFHDNEIGELINEKSDFILANNPFSLNGEKWKERRAEVTPALTMGRIKSVYPVTNKVCKSLADYIREEIRINNESGVEGRDLTLRFTSDVVTDCVLGLKADSFSKNPTPIVNNIKLLFEQSWPLIVYFVLISLFPILRSIYKIRFIPKKSEEFFSNLMQNAIDMRHKQIKNDQQLDRVDFLNYMIQLQEKKNLSTRQLMAHTMTFLIDGFETTATALAHVLLMLGRNLSAQEKLRNEITTHLNKNGILDFDKLHELPYLDACIYETLRIFPPGFISNKLCTEKIELPNRNGDNIIIEKGQTVIVPLYAFMCDEDYFPNPQEFKPERFTSDVDAIKKYRERGIFLPFGDGPRICLGMRFALTQIKAALVEIVQNFNIKVNSKTRADNEFDASYFLTRLKDGIWLDFEELKIVN